MPKTLPELGSPAWVDHVFSTPPAREVKGRTKWTHRHAVFIPHLGRLAYMESRTELCAALALEYLHTTGHLVRFKEQPFVLDQDGFTTCPDFMAQSRANYIVEQKSARFLTLRKVYELKNLGDYFAQHNLIYLLWTDHWPLSSVVRHNLIQMKRSSAQDVSSAEHTRLCQLLRGAGQLPLGEILRADIDLMTALSLVWKGQAYFNLTEEIHENLCFSITPRCDLPGLFFNARPDPEEWWNALSRC